MGPCSILNLYLIKLLNSDSNVVKGNCLLCIEYFKGVICNMQGWNRNLYEPDI